MPLQRYNDWQPAAEKSRRREAISDPFDYIIPGESRILKVCIIKPLHGDPYLVYNSAQGIRVKNTKVTSREVDKVKRWATV